MFRIVDEREVPEVKPYRISVEPGVGLTPAGAEVRRSILERMGNLKAHVFNGLLLDLIDELELRAKDDPDRVELVVKVKGTHSSYGGQYLEMNFFPEIDREFRRMWEERHRWKDDPNTYEDLLVASESADPGWWTIKLERGPNISNEWTPTPARLQANPEKYLSVRRGWWEIRHGLGRIFKRASSRV